MQVNISICALLGEEDVVQLLTLDIVTLYAGRDGTFNVNSSPTMHTMTKLGGIL